MLLDAGADPHQRETARRRCTGRAGRAPDSGARSCCSMPATTAASQQHMTPLRASMSGDSTQCGDSQTAMCTTTARERV
jgi:hypothetical protein